MESEDLKCPMPNCKSDRVESKSSIEEFNPNMEILICTKCMCNFKKDGTIIKEGDCEKFERLEKERLKPKRRKKHGRRGKKPKKKK